MTKLETKRSNEVEVKVAKDKVASHATPKVGPLNIPSSSARVGYRKRPS